MMRARHSAGGVPSGAASVEVDATGPRPGDDAGGSHWGLVMRGGHAGVPGSAALCDAFSATGSSGATGLGVSSLLLPGFPCLPPSPIDWRLVEDNAELACSHVADMERLLHDTLASVDCNILRPLRVSLKKREESLPICLGLPLSFLSSCLCFSSTCHGVVQKCLHCMWS
jgi:hypothetical protein